MRRLWLVVVVLLAVPSVALAADLDELLEESKGASYSAEQLISCDTEDGVRDVLIELEQKGGEIRYGNRSDDDPQIFSGHGGWSGPSGASQLEAGPETALNSTVVENVYTVDDGIPTEYLGRSATSYTLTRGDTVRAALVVDDELGVFLSVVSYDADGAVYCERRFVSFDPDPPDWKATPSTETETLDLTAETDLPDRLGDFVLVDVFSDNAGLTLAYYSDGFFSFAVFESGLPIEATDTTSVKTARGTYQREYTPGQVTYTWLVERGGMALIGDLPPDLHEDVLANLDAPTQPGFFNRLWRSIFG